MAAAREIMWITREMRAAGTQKALLLCGKGNNAGDAFVIARLLPSQGWETVWVPLAGEDFSELASANLKRMPSPVTKKEMDTADFDVDMIIDGVFGTGFRGELPVAIRAAFQKANEAKALRVALDIPSGLDCDTGQASPDTYMADFTLTFGVYKPGLLFPEGARFCGEVRCLDIGL